MDEDFGDLNILTRKKGSYSADMVYTMIYDRLLTLNNDGSFSLDLIESWTTIEENIGADGGYTPLSYPNITAAPGWKVPPEITDLILGSSNGYDIAICRIYEGVTFHNGENFTVDNLITLVNFANAQPTDTLIYQTWAPVIITKIDDYTFSFGVNTQGFNLGFMDVMYNLASPQGSVVYIDGNDYTIDGYPVGTGAYQLEEVIADNSVNFERWNDWWHQETVPMQYVTFQYISDSVAALNSILAAECAAAVMRYTDDQEYILTELSENDEEWYDLWENQIMLLEGNPLALFFNTDTTERLFGETRYRQAATAALNKNIIFDVGGLHYESYDFWSCLRNEDASSTLPINNLEYAQSLIEEAGVPIGLFEIDMVVYNNNYFPNSTYAQYYNNVCTTVQQYLTALFGYYDVTVNMISASESEMAAYEANGNYDIMLKEIDLHNINSAHNALYGKGSQDIDDWLYYSSIAINANTFMQTHLAAQWYNYTDYTYITNLGWQKRAVIWNENVSGISVCEGFCPTGDSSMLDFRFIGRETE